MVKCRKEERDTPISSQVDKGKAKAAIVRENLVKSLSQKRTFVELEDALIDFKADSKREQRRKTGTAGAKGKEKESSLDEGELIGLMKEMVTLVKSITASISATPRRRISTLTRCRGLPTKRDPPAVRPLHEKVRPTNWVGKKKGPTKPRPEDTLG